MKHIGMNYLPILMEDMLATPAAPSPSPAAFLLRQGLKVSRRLRLLLGNGDAAPPNHFRVHLFGNAPFPSLLSLSNQGLQGAHSCTHSVLTSPCADWLASIYFLAGPVSQRR